MSELQSSVASRVGTLAGTPAAPATTLLARWYVLIMMCLVYTLSIADRYVVSTVLDPIKDGVIRREQVHELGDIVLGKVRVSQPPRQGPGREIIYYKNNSGLAIQFAAAGGIMYRRVLAEGSNRTIPTEWLGSDLSAYYQAGFRPSP